mgnify:CR=1 FL=1
MVKIYGDSTIIKYTVSPEGSEKRPEPIIPSKTQNAQLPINKNLKINEKYTFSAFIEGAHNQFAKAAALNVSKTPGQQSFNPLVIYGGVGMGKTHLLHAIGNKISIDGKQKKIVCASSEKFTLDFISSIQKNKTVEFSKSYRSADVLLIDDIQFFQGKEQTQEQFFHTFNELYQSGKQIVLTADRYPGEMQGLQDRLLSRWLSCISITRGTSLIFNLADQFSYFALIVHYKLVFHLTNELSFTHPAPSTFNMRFQDFDDLPWAFPPNVLRLALVIYLLDVKPKPCLLAAINSYTCRMLVCIVSGSRFGVRYCPNAIAISSVQNEVAPPSTLKP